MNDYKYFSFCWHLKNPQQQTKPPLMRHKKFMCVGAVKTQMFETDCGGNKKSVFVPPHGHTKPGITFF